MKIDVYCYPNLPDYQEEKELCLFLATHLENYGDPLEHIQKAVDYALQRNGSAGGYLIIAKNKSGKIVGAVVLNKTGMDGYIPGNILVYIATHQSHRGEGIGKKLMEIAIRLSQGGLALHVEPENPAKKLYEKFGFKSKYLEMRLTT
jgi:ribosomal-protein-alanine N-acetyltransferase